MSAASQEVQALQEVQARTWRQQHRKNKLQNSTHRNTRLPAFAAQEAAHARQQLRHPSLHLCVWKNST
jgi:hypothetical protein